MRALLRSAWRALLHKGASPETVAEALRGDPGIKSVSVHAAASQATVTLFLAEGADAYEVVCRATDRLHERLPRAELQVLVRA